MATTAAPYGLKPVKRADGLPYAGATTTYLIDPAGEGTNIFNGQVVYIGADGYIALTLMTGANAGAAGISPNKRFHRRFGCIRWLLVHQCSRPTDLRSILPKWNYWGC